jgi:hypothetical protein
VREQWVPLLEKPAGPETQTAQAATTGSASAR